MIYFCVLRSEHDIDYKIENGDFELPINAMERALLNEAIAEEEAAGNRSGVAAMENRLAELDKAFKARSESRPMVPLPTHLGDHYKQLADSKRGA